MQGLSQNLHQITGSTFINIQAKANGGAIYFENINGIIQSNIFTSVSNS